MSGIFAVQSTPLRVLRSVQTPGSGATVVLLDAVPVKGYGTIRIFAAGNDQQVTLNVYQRPDGSSFTMRQTNTAVVAANPTTAPAPMNVVADLAKVELVAGVTPPASVELEITLFP